MRVGLALLASCDSGVRVFLLDLGISLRQDGEFFVDLDALYSIYILLRILGYILVFLSYHEGNLGIESFRRMIRITPYVKLHLSAPSSSATFYGVKRETA